MTPPSYTSLPEMISKVTAVPKSTTIGRGAVTCSYPHRICQPICTDPAGFREVDSNPKIQIRGNFLHLATEQISKNQGLFRDH